VCVSVFANDRVRVLHSAYPGQVANKVAETGYVTLPARNFLALGQYALINMFMKNRDLKAARGMDLKMMSGALGSSVHVPGNFEGRPGTMNFWSREKDAFPKETDPLVRALAEAALRGR